MRNLVICFWMIVLTAQASSASKADFVLDDGDFANWSFGYYDYVSGYPVGAITRLSTGGNQGAYLSGVSPVGQFGPMPYAIYNGISTTQAIEGEVLDLTFDLRTNFNPGTINGIRVYAVVEQNGMIYYQYNGVLLGSSNWGRGGFNGQVQSNAFISLDGTQNPDFRVGKPTRLGFAITSNATNVDIDNLHISLTLTAVPEPSSGIMMVGSCLLLSVFRSRRSVRCSAAS